MEEWEEASVYSLKCQGEREGSREGVEEGLSLAGQI